MTLLLAAVCMACHSAHAVHCKLQHTVAPFRLALPCHLAALPAFMHILLAVIPVGGTMSTDDEMLHIH